VKHSDISKSIEANRRTVCRKSRNINRLGHRCMNYAKLL